jgi:acyl-coenzyme A thioesterase PaaI-like protein
MGTTVSRFLWVNNKGSLPAAMEATVTAAGVTYGPYSVGTAAAKSSMSMASAIDTALTTAGVTLAQNSRANIEFTSPVKAGDVTISAAYKHIADADRLTLETSDTVVGAINCTGTNSTVAIVRTGGGAAADVQTDDTLGAGTTTDACTNAK